MIILIHSCKRNEEVAVTLLKYRVLSPRVCVCVWVGVEQGMERKWRIEPDTSPHLSGQFNRITIVFGFCWAISRWSRDSVTKARRIIRIPNSWKRSIGSLDPREYDETSYSIIKWFWVAWCLPMESFVFHDSGNVNMATVLANFDRRRDISEKGKNYYRFVSSSL